MSSAPQKSDSAFRTISEVAEDLDVQQHVLRFWETKFGQIKPLKRGGGRRYYRPEDVALLKKIHTLLYVEGYTIKGVQKLLKGVSKSQVLEDQKKPQQAAQAYGANLPQVTPADLPVTAAAPSQPLSFAEADAYAATQTPGMDPRHKIALQAVLAELMEMREQLRAVTGESEDRASDAA